MGLLFVPPMETPDSDMVFAGSVPELYDRHLVPLIFEPYAADLVERLKTDAPQDVLEIASGTGVVTRAMAAGLDGSVSITATDLSQSMIEHGKSAGTTRPVIWRQADVMSLPFPDNSFDAVVCQFGVMFFPDKRGAYAEVHRVLRPGGTFLFNVWDRIETNEFADWVTRAMAQRYPANPPRFLARTPHGYFDEAQINSDVEAAGFDESIGFHVLEARSRAATCEIPAIAYCQGTPLRNEIEALEPAGLGAATSAAAQAIAQRFGRTDVDGLIRGFVVTARRLSGTSKHSSEIGLPVVPELSV